MPQVEGLVIVREGTSSVVLDSRAWPVVITTWFGTPTEVLVDRYFDQHATVLERARKNSDRIVLISDTFATERPTATARKRIADRTSAHAKVAQSITLASFIVIENALIRGAVTALSWIIPSMDENELVDSIETAIDRGLAALDAAGIARPAGLRGRTYHRPARP
jgi:hypothetical protein